MNRPLTSPALPACRFQTVVRSGVAMRKRAVMGAMNDGAPPGAQVNCLA